MNEHWTLDRPTLLNVNDDSTKQEEYLFDFMFETRTYNAHLRR